MRGAASVPQVAPLGQSVQLIGAGASQIKDTCIPAIEWPPPQQVHWVAAVVTDPRAAKIAQIATVPRACTADQAETPALPRVACFTSASAPGARFSSVASASGPPSASPPRCAAWHRTGGNGEGHQGSVGVVCGGGALAVGMGDDWGWRPGGEEEHTRWGMVTFCDRAYFRSLVDCDTTTPVVSRPK